MAQVFQNFVTGLEAGQQNRDLRARRSALEEAGRMYGAGEYDAAETALLTAGMPDLAGQYSALAEARRGRQRRHQVAEAMRNVAPEATPQTRLQAGSSAALAAGDPDQWFQFEQAANQMGAQERQVAAERAGWIGSAAASLLEVPAEQRVERARALVAASPYATDPAILQMIDEAPELTDEALTSAAQSSMSAAEILAGRRQERQFEQSLAQQRALSYAREARDPLATIEGRADYGRYTEYQNAAVAATNEVLPRLQEARQAIVNAAERMGQPLDASTNVRLSRLFGHDAEGRAALEILRARTIPMAIAATRGLQPISNFEFTQALNSVANADMTPAAALARIDDAINEATRVRDLGLHAERYWEENRSLRGFTGAMQDQAPAPATGAAPPAATESGWRPGQPVPAAAVERVRANPALIEEFKATFGLSDAEARRLIGGGGGGAQYRRPDGPMTRG